VAVLSGGRVFDIPTQRTWRSSNGGGFASNAVTATLARTF
jgi:hypothetical protein